MTRLNALEDALRQWPQPFESGEYAVMPTLLLYPSGALVRVYAAFGRSTVQLSDGGGAYDEIIRKGDFGFDPLRVLRSVSGRFSLHIDDRGWIITDQVSNEEAATFIALVANASHEAAQNLVRRFKPYENGDYRTELDTLLQRRYRDQLKKEIVIQGRDKPHRFDYAIRGVNERTILLDAVVPDTNSINSALVSHLDVKRSENAEFLQRIIYDDRDDWSSSDISLLNVGAKTIRFSTLPDFLDRNAAPQLSDELGYNEQAN